MDDLGGGGTKRRQSLQFIAFPGKSVGCAGPSLEKEDAKLS